MLSMYSWLASNTPPQGLLSWSACLLCSRQLRYSAFFTLRALPSAKRKSRDLFLYFLRITHIREHDTDRSQHLHVCGSSCFSHFSACTAIHLILLRRDVAPSSIVAMLPLSLCESPASAMQCALLGLSRSIVEIYMSVRSFSPFMYHSSSPTLTPATSPLQFPYLFLSPSP